MLFISSIKVCVSSIRNNCLSPPCVEWGECRDLFNRMNPSMIPAPLSCRPNQAILSDTCSRLSFYVDVAKLRPSINTEDLCYEIRKLISLREAGRSTQLEIVALCELKQSYNDTVEITLVSTISNNAIEVSFFGKFCLGNLSRRSRFHFACEVFAEISASSGVGVEGL